MQLDARQLDEFEQRGCLFFPSLLEPDEVVALQQAIPALLGRQGPEVIREKKQANCARLVFGAHLYCEPFRRLARLGRLLNPVRQLLASEVYLHQSRLNPKEGFSGGASWEWHQDYPPWHLVDGMPDPRCIMTSIFIDDCTAAKSPLLVVPGTQRHGLLDSKPHRDAKGYALYHIDHETLGRLAETNGIEPLIGPAGSVAFIHCNVVHGSANNVSPWRRSIMYLIYNACTNACTSTLRPWYQNHRDFTPLSPLAEDRL